MVKLVQKTANDYRKKANDYRKMVNADNKTIKLNWKTINAGGIGKCPVLYKLTDKQIKVKVEN